MTDTASLLQRGNYPPFLPRNFYEAPQYASYRPTEAITFSGQAHPPVTSSAANLAAFSPCDVATTGEPAQVAKPISRQRKWALEVRAREIHGWLDNLHLLYENHVQAKGNYSTGFGTARHHVCGGGATDRATIKASPQLASVSAVKKARGRPKKFEINRLKPYLQNFIFPRDALSALHMFDDIVTGTVVADAGGNTRPFSKTRMVAFLQSLDVISAQAIQGEMQCSLRHAQKIAMCLRIFERTAFKVAEDHWYKPTVVDWPEWD